MPELHDHDVPKRDPEEFSHDPRHDSLMSDPELREAFTRYEEEGYTRDEAYYLARKEVEGEDWEPENPEDYEGVDLSKMALPLGDFDYEACDDALFEAHEKSVQWGVNEDNPDLSKSPGIWTSDDQVPDAVLDVIETMIDTGRVVWQGGYASLPPGAEAKVIEILEDQLTDPSGWSLGSLIDALIDFYPDVEEDEVATIFRNETSALLNQSRERLYELRDDSEEYVYDWIGPTDHRTTEICRGIEEEIEDRGGAVPLDDLKEILRTFALAYEGGSEGGTPDRVDAWQPHYQCRRTFVRRVQSI